VRGMDLHPNVDHVAKDPDKLGRDGDEGGKGVGVLDHINVPAKISSASDGESSRSTNSFSFAAVSNAVTIGTRLPGLGGIKSYFSPNHLMAQ
jgi:hypothetical protein